MKAKLTTNPGAITSGSHASILGSSALFVMQTVRKTAAVRPPYKAPNPRRNPLGKNVYHQISYCTPATVREVHPQRRRWTHWLQRAAPFQGRHGYVKRTPGRPG